MNRRALFLLVVMPALLLSAAPASAQATQIDPPAATQTKPDDAATSGIGRGDHASDRTTEDRPPGDGNNPPANPPARDETVGVGGSVDRAPRDIREPFDE
jgi:hypothetical protein